MSPVARTLNRGEFYFPAEQATILAERGVFGRERLAVSGPSGGQVVRVVVTPVSRPELEEMRHALTAAGVNAGSLG